MSLLYPENIPLDHFPLKTNAMDLSFRSELVGEDSFIAPTATVRGNVRLGKRCTVLFGAVLRGDADCIEVGECTNLQDLVCVHADPGLPCRIGDRVTVGHGAIIHGATVESDCLIGIRATILNGAVIGRGSVVAAGALVTEGKVIPPNSLVMGVPAKVVREAVEREHSMIERGWQHYVEINESYRNQLRSEQTRATT
jgi:carbonic anhydrase/acetyltransferase-like protein (isoleucine patch superfamily)